MRYENNKPQRSGQLRSLAELVDAICKHPGMFTPGGTFGEAASWLQGYSSGLNRVEPDMASDWYEFLEWLPQRLNYPSNFIWHFILKSRYPEDEIALEQLTSLYAEYLSTLKEGNDKPSEFPE